MSKVSVTSIHFLTKEEALLSVDASTLSQLLHKSFDDVERVVVNNDKKISIATTSCNIVNWNTFEQELLNNDLIVKRKWISEKIPEFNPAMCVVVCRNE